MCKKHNFFYALPSKERVDLAMKIPGNFLMDALQLFYPHCCVGCGTDIAFKNEMLCLHCLNELPHTQFENIENNPVEKIFYGRVPLLSAYSQFYFARHQLVQHLIHQLKYKGNQEIGEYLGMMMGQSICKSSRIKKIDFLIPLPLHADKEFKRGYNQAEVICRGIEKSAGILLAKNNVIKQKFTETQTKKHRAERWENVETSFKINEPEKLAHKHVMIVDDVVTTGATLEACAQALRAIPGISISIATLAMVAK